VAAALRAADHLAHLLSQASYLAQLRRGDTPVDLSHVDLARIVEAAVQSVQSAPELNLNCDVRDIAGTHVIANRERLRESITNLIGAVARAQMAPRTVGITTQRTKHEQREGVRLRVEAMGVAGPVIEGALDTTRGGLGLDLPIAEGVIASLGGRVSELTASGRCVGMIVWLPVAP
jgi:signal transduction histidine kinase